MGRDGDKPLLLLIGSSSRRSREFILRSVSRRYALWLLQPAPVTWEEPYVVGSTQVDNTRPELLVEAARQVAAEHEVTGVFCYDEGLVTPAAHVSEALGLPGNSPETVIACRDKNATRTALERAGVAQPASIGVRSLAEAQAAADKIGFPVVLKPRGLAGGMGVRRADGPDEVDSAYRAATGVTYPGVPVFEVSVLVEEYVDGPEISVDAVFFEGEGTPLAVARKQVGLAPFFEETGHEVDAADPLLSDPRLLEALRASHAALGFHTGVSHTEFRLTADGPRLMEVNARLGGDMIPYLGELATGVDIAMAAADVAAGRRPETTPTRRRAAAITFLYPERDTEIESVTVHEDRLTPEIHSAEPMADPGAVLRLPPRGYISRYARVIALADSMERARAALLGAPEIVEIAGRPAQEPPR
ncbi:ATP-grasp domain-containing protein [Streptomyces sp. NPDC038707]|uniref:ATP-grasp domain-containing protein n=1 Tax=Streptomyces achromogenes subsp. streptozoticus TaxID=285532 RepID=A0A411EVE4_STRC2|nr:ATP-grasp domain-containing protein [Streptomyces achromogenes subsp. streptozoticus]QBA82204.1 ATP-grasp domain-containing protein [Streptomyces achromogenes subsp. streptozoticus]QBF29332.1 argininosuccinate lyase [Streptomyces achromogenes subsp. streptozoticus]